MMILNHVTPVLSPEFISQCDLNMASYITAPLLLKELLRGDHKASSDRWRMEYNRKTNRLFTISLPDKRRITIIKTYNILG